MGELPDSEEAWQRTAARVRIMARIWAKLRISLAERDALRRNYQMFPAIRGAAWFPALPPRPVVQHVPEMDNYQIVPYGNWFRVVGERPDDRKRVLDGFATEDDAIGWLDDFLILLGPIDRMSGKTGWGRHEGTSVFLGSSQVARPFLGASDVPNCRYDNIPHRANRTEIPAY